MAARGPGAPRVPGKLRIGGKKPLSSSFIPLLKMLSNTSLAQQSTDRCPQTGRLPSSSSNRTSAWRWHKKNLLQKALVQPPKILDLLALLVSLSCLLCLATLACCSHAPHRPSAEASSCTPSTKTLSQHLIIHNADPHEQDHGNAQPHTWQLLASPLASSMHPRFLVLPL